MKTTHVNITGMHCASCEMLISEALTDVAGVHTAKVNAKEGTAVITHDDAISKAQLCKTIEAEGYKAS